MSYTKKYSQGFRRDDIHEETVTDTETIRRRTSTLTSYRKVVERQPRETPDGPEIDPDAVSVPPVTALLPKQIPRHSGDRRA